MTEKRFTMFGDMANIKQWILDKKDNSRMSSKWEMLDKLNELVDENEQLKEERDYFKRKKCEYFNKYNKKHLDNIQLRKENEQLKDKCYNIRENAKEYQRFVRVLKKEYDELKQQNTNQYNQLNELWELIKAKDWETLTEMDNRMKEEDE